MYSLRGVHVGNQELFTDAVICFSVSLAKEPHIGGEGMRGAGLALDQLKLLQRFDPSAVTVQGMDIKALQDSREDDLISLANKDCIGFFIAKFIKLNGK